MYSWGAHEQDEAGNPILNSRQTLDVIKFVKSLFEETMTAEVFTWDQSSNNRFMLAGKCSLAVNPISITREAENKGMTDISRKIQLAKALKGPVRTIGLWNPMSCYVVWKFSENIAGAKKFLVDYTTDFKQAFLASQFYEFPCFPKTVPNLKQIIANDDRAHPPDKYGVLEDGLNWTTNVGYPGYAYRRHDASVFLYAFDLIELNGDDLRREPIETRKATLASVLRRAVPGVRMNEHIEADGPTVFAYACKMGLEGIVSKRKDSTYRSGRSPDWLKSKNPCEAVRREEEEDWVR
jgi:hypothetical protein